jgi:hypothetical protein
MVGFLYIRKKGRKGGRGREGGRAILIYKEKEKRRAGGSDSYTQGKKKKRRWVLIYKGQKKRKGGLVSYIQGKRKKGGAPTKKRERATAVKDLGETQL